MRAQIFTVVIDKKEHQERHSEDTWNPYDYTFGVLLNRVRGWLNLRGATADIMPEARGPTEDNQLQSALVRLHVEGLNMATGEDYKQAFPDEDLKFSKKEHNVAGHQIADLISADQKMLTVQEYEKPLAYPTGPFGLKINRAIKRESKSIWAVSFRIAQKMEKTGLKPAFTTLALTGNPLLLQ